MHALEARYCARLERGGLFSVPLTEIASLAFYEAFPESFPAESSLMAQYAARFGVDRLLFTPGGHWFLPEDHARAFPPYFSYTKGLPALDFTESAMISVGFAHSERQEPHGWLCVQKGADNFPVHFAYADDAPEEPLYAVHLPAPHPEIAKTLYASGVHWDALERHTRERIAGKVNGRRALHPEKDPYEDLDVSDCYRAPLAKDFMYPYLRYASRVVERHEDTVYHIRRAVFLPLNIRETELLLAHQSNALDGIDMPDYYRIGGEAVSPDAFAGTNNCIEFAIALLHRVFDTAHHNLYADLHFPDDLPRRVKHVDEHLARAQKTLSTHLPIAKGFVAVSDAELMGRKSSLVQTAPMSNEPISEYDLLPSLRQRATHIALPELNRHHHPEHLTAPNRWVERIQIESLGLMPHLVGIEA